MWIPSSASLISNSSTTLDKSNGEYKWGNILPSDACSQIKWSNFNVSTLSKTKFFALNNTFQEFP